MQAPLIQWFTSHFGQAPSRASGFGVAEHPPALREQLARIAAGLDDWRLVGLHSIVAAAKSAICGYAVMEGAATVDAAIAAARVEEEYQVCAAVPSLVCIAKTLITVYNRRDAGALWRAHTISIVPLLV
jgi:chaperone required for assembly of F1-ATPase